MLSWGFFHFSPSTCAMGDLTATNRIPKLAKGQVHSSSRRKAKSLKALEYKPRFVLGHDVFMEKVGTLCHRALIGRLEYCSMTKDG